MLNDSNGNSFCFGMVDDPQVKTLPWLFRHLVPGYQDAMSQ